MKPEAKVSEEKIEAVKEFSDLIGGKRTILVASIKNLPASQFQEISKKLRGKAVVKVPKKNLIIRAIENSKDEKLKEIEKFIGEDIAILFSDEDSFDLSSELLENKNAIGAKRGQEAPEDIKVEAGPTDLMPGPAISEMGALGIQIQMDKGKIAIKESKVIVKKGEKISENAASMMNKLDIKPFYVGFIPVAAFDIKEGKLYSEIKINKEETLNELKNSFGKALAFAVEIEYFSGDTIKFIIGKAARNEKALEIFMEKQKVEEKTEEKKEEEKKEENLEDNKEDNQTQEVNSEEEK